MNLEERDDFAFLVAEIYEAAGAVRSAGETIAQSVGQTQARWQVLGAIFVEPMSVAGVARRLGVSRQGVQRIVDLLTQEGLVMTMSNPAHQRSPLFEITPEGKKILMEIRKVSRAWHRRVMSEYKGQDLEKVRSSIELFVKAVRAKPPKV